MKNIKNIIEIFCIFIAVQGKKYRIYDVKVGNQEYKREAVVALQATSATEIKVCEKFVNYFAAFILIIPQTQFFGFQTFVAGRNYHQR